MAFQFDFVYLLKALKERKSIDIIYKEEEKTWHYSSRFLMLSLDGKSFIIDLPFLGEDTYKPLEVGFTIQIVFKLAGFRFQFGAEVQEKVQYIIDKEKKIPALKISWPTEILEENRRSFFRVELSMNDSIKVAYHILGNAEERTEKKQGEPVHTAEGKGVDAIAVDISENGLKIRVNSIGDIKVNDLIRLCFRLKEPDDEYVEIDGIVRHISEDERIPAFFCGIEFSRKDSLRHKQAVRKVVFYLMSKHQENVNFFSVDTIVSKNPLVRRIVEGEVSGELLNMLLDKEFRLTNEEYIESLAFVVNKNEYVDRATALLQEIPLPVKAKYVERMDANHQAAYCLLTEAVQNGSMGVVTGVVNNQYLPVEFWLKIAKEGSEPMLGLLLENPNKLIAYPEVLHVMLQNPGITPVIEKSIDEIESRYLDEVEPDVIPMEGLIPEVQKVIKKQLSEKGEKINIFTTAKARMEAISTLKRINAMNTRERIRLAYCGNKPERMILAGGQSKEVLLSLVESPWIGEDEILALLENEKIPAAVVEKIADNSCWLRSYPIILALVKHANVPVKKAPGFLKRLRWEDLKEIVINKKINPYVLEIADRIFEKTILKK